VRSYLKNKRKKVDFEARQELEFLIAWVLIGQDTGHKSGLGWTKQAAVTLQGDYKF
jgi:hypothetical protein